MKKIIMFSALVFCLASCNKSLELNDKPIETKEITLTANMDQFSDESKTTISGKEVFWSENDEIEVYNSDGAHATFTLTDGVGTKCGKFTGTLEGTAVAAYYPADGCVSYSESTGFTAEFTNAQVYSEGSVGNGAFPMAGTISGHDITFKNACGLVKLSLKGTGKVKSIVLTDINNPIAGNFKVTTDGIATYTDGGKYKLTLSCPEPVALSETVAADFYIALPAGALSGGFCAEIMNVMNHPAEVLFTKKTANTISRNRCTAMPEKTGLTMSLPTGYKEAEYLLQNGTTPYINTGLTVSDDYAINTRLSVIEYTSFNTPIGARQVSKYYYFGRYNDANGWTFWTGGPVNDQTRRYTKDKSYGEIEYSAVFSGTSAKHLFLGKLYETGIQNLPTNKIFLFAANRCTAEEGEGVPYYNSKDCKFYYCTMIKSNVLERNLIPCVALSAGTDANGKEYEGGAAGFCDKAHGTFYSNAAESGTFTAYIPPVPVDYTLNGSNETFTQKPNGNW